MIVKDIFWLAFAVSTLIHAVFADIDFFSCGGSRVRYVYIRDCLQTPCAIRMGDTIQAHIIPENIDTPVLQTNVEAGLIQVGAYFAQTAVCLNPCISSCTLTPAAETSAEPSEPKFDLNITISNSLIQLPSTLRINTRYIDYLGQSSRFCIEVSTTVIR
ncbi:uncharacterized protein LOC109542726 [Dendroctonus ponderosae]